MIERKVTSYEENSKVTHGEWKFDVKTSVKNQEVMSIIVQGHNGVDGLTAQYQNDRRIVTTIPNGIESIGLFAIIIGIFKEIIDANQGTTELP